MLIGLATGAVLDAAIGPHKGKRSGESTLLRGLHGRLKWGDIALSDRCFCSYFEVALLLAQGVDVVMRQHGSRPVDFRSGHRLGHDDHTVEWSKPQRASWMDPETYAAMPETLTIRELRVRVVQRGFRTRTLILMTTLLDAEEFSHDELAGLYRARWHAEVCQADCMSRNSLYLSVRTSHSERGGAAEPGPLAPGTPARHPRATAMRRDLERPAPPRPQAA